MSTQSPNEPPTPVSIAAPDTPVLLDPDNTITPAKRAKPVLSKLALTLLVLAGLPQVLAVFGVFWLFTDTRANTAILAGAADAIVTAMTP